MSFLWSYVDGDVERFVPLSLRGCALATGCMGALHRPADHCLVSAVSDLDSKAGRIQD